MIRNCRIAVLVEQPVGDLIAERCGRETVSSFVRRILLKWYRENGGEIDIPE